ncbi:MAG TPA: redoxin domain-containing protein [Pyrinomonadaceae bacterium]|nr:redoxin domain-containing protein [Pyrinomonadaceae bacterium]
MFFMIRVQRVWLATTLTLAFLVCGGYSALSQENSGPIRWAIKTETGTIEIRAGGTFFAQLVASIDDGWYLYSPEQSPGGPLPTRISLVKGQPFKLAGEIETSLPRTSFDTNFNMETQVFEGEAVFKLPVAVLDNTEEGGAYTLSVAVTFQSCNETTCLPPRTVSLTADVRVFAAARAVPRQSVIGAEAPNRGVQLGSGLPSVLSEGMEVPEFSFTDFEGRERRLSEFRGKYLLIDFWATWCKPCIAEIPYLKKLYNKYRSHGFEILGMDSETLGQGNSEVDPQFVKDTDERARQIIRTHRILWIQATAETAVPLADGVFGVQSLPWKILLDREGKIVTRVKDGKELDEMLTRLLSNK